MLEKKKSSAKGEKRRDGTRGENENEISGVFLSTSFLHNLRV